MNPNSHLFAPIALLISLLASCASQQPAGTSEEVDFVKDIKPLLQDRCLMCHNRETLPERTSFESKKLALAGDKQGPVIVPGNASASRLILAISASEVHEQAMPPVSIRVSKEELALLSKWIDQGAEWPAGMMGRIVPTERVME